MQFLMTGIMKNMTKDPYLRPLAAFRSRILYANAYGTDFVVPCSTAAFLHRQSSYPHHSFSDQDPTDEDHSTPPTEDSNYSMEQERLHPYQIRRDRYKGGKWNSAKHDFSMDETSMVTGGQQRYKRNLFVTTLHTLPKAPSPAHNFTTLHDTTFTSNHSLTMTHSSSKTPLNTVAQPWASTVRNFVKKQTWEWGKYETIDDNTLLEMSLALDSLGWRKIFVDVREEIPLQVPVFNIPTFSRDSWGINVETGIDLRSPGVWESRDIAQVLSFPDKIMSFPIGHNMMVAFSRNPWSSFVYRGGRPIMDQLVGFSHFYIKICLFPKSNHGFLREPGN
jgi:hypothetical protein